MILKCVKCGTPGLESANQAWECRACGSSYPVVNGVARFVASEHYTSSFGYQWNRFAKAQLDSANGTHRSRDTFVEKTGFTLETLAGKAVLDAGCGMGRFAEVCADAGADVHAMDLSTAVDAAARNLGRRKNVAFYQADIMNPPFADATFDVIYSIGVLHHTPDTKKAFLSLVRLLKPGGRIAIWVYSTRLRLMIGSEVLRTITPYLSKPFLLKAARLAIPLYYIHRLPLIGAATRVLLPTSLNPDPEWRWLDTFDWYSPRYQWKHTYTEVEEWFAQAGLTDLASGSFPVSVSGSRPSAA